MLGVVGTLVMVEEVPPPASLAGGSDEPLLGSATPVSTVTSRIRTTIKYLRAEAGRFAMFRGFGYLLVYVSVEGLINGVLVACLRPLLSFVVDIVVPIFTIVLLWRLNNAWLHKVISKPSQKNWYTRVREQKGSVTVKLAIFLWALGRSVTFFILKTLLDSLVLKKFETLNGRVRFHGSVPQTILEYIGIQALELVLMLLFVPVNVILVRIQASMLPANDEGIVLLDKALCKSVALESVDGNTASEPMTGDSKLTIPRAWRSFAWPARICLLKVYAKYFAIQTALTVVWAVVVIVGYLAFKSPPAEHALVARAV